MGENCVNSVRVSILEIYQHINKLLTTYLLSKVNCSNSAALQGLSLEVLVSKLIYSSFSISIIRHNSARYDRINPVGRFSSIA